MWASQQKREVTQYWFDAGSASNQRCVNVSRFAGL